MTISTESMEGDITRVILDGRLDIEGAAAIDLPMAGCMHSLFRLWAQNHGEFCLLRVE